MNSAAVARRPRAGDVILIVLVGVVAMLFAGFTAAYLIRRSGSDWVPVDLPWTATAGTGLLIASSITLELACRRSSRRMIVVSLLLGVVFLASQVLTWHLLGERNISLPTSAHGAFVITLTAVHGVHLAGGVFALIYVSIRNVGARPCALYWHFMGLVWIYLLFLLSI
jgi:cytochrome c oxidase subunit III